MPLVHRRHFCARQKKTCRRKDSRRHKLTQAMPYVEMFTKPEIIAGFGIVFGIIGAVIIVP